MSHAYWTQYSPIEIMCMHGLDLDHIENDFETNLSREKDDTDLIQEESCKYCNARGCNFCLMLEW